MQTQASLLVLLALASLAIGQREFVESAAPLATTAEPKSLAELTSPTSTTTSSSADATVQKPPSDAEYENVEPAEMNLCIESDSSAYKLNQTWSDDTCGQTCRCVFRSEPRKLLQDVRVQSTLNMYPNSEQTEIRCSLPAQCAHLATLLVSGADCPIPKLLSPPTSGDICACPVLTCGRPDSPSASASRDPKAVKATTIISPITKKNSTTSPASTTPRAHQPTGCRWRKQADRLLRVGENVYDGCESICRCSEDGEIRCQPHNCLPMPPEELYCAHGWQLDDINFRRNSSEGRCCPNFVCKPEQSTQVDLVRPCDLMGKVIAHGDRLPEGLLPQDPSCERVCTCNDSRIVCKPLCSALSDDPPEDLACSAEQAYRSTDGCCPRWVCPITEEYALKSFSVAPMNATAVEVTFVLPMFALNRRGRAELNYTSVAVSQSPRDQPPADARWLRRANIKTADGIYISQTIKYQLFNLKPEHKYWFKLVVHFSESQQPFDEPLESPLQAVVMPALPVVASAAPSDNATPITTAPTPTTTPSPIILLLPNSRTSSTTAAPTTTTLSATESPSSPFPGDLVKPDVSSPSNQSAPPCVETNQIDWQPLAWVELIQSQVNGPLQRYAWLMLVCLSMITIMFTIVSYLYFRRSFRVTAPITSYPVYDNSAFNKHVSYYANKKHKYIVDESRQNFANDSILAKQKNFEVDKDSPLQCTHKLDTVDHLDGQHHLI